MQITKEVRPTLASHHTIIFETLRNVSEVEDPHTTSITTTISTIPNNLRSILPPLLLPRFSRVEVANVWRNVAHNASDLQLHGAQSTTMCFTEVWNGFFFFSKNTRNNITLNKATKILRWHVLFLRFLEEFRRVYDDNCACSARNKWNEGWTLLMEFNIVPCMGVNGKSWRVFF